MGIKKALKNIQVVFSSVTTLFPIIKQCDKTPIVTMACSRHSDCGVGVKNRGRESKGKAGD